MEPSEFFTLFVVERGWPASLMVPAPGGLEPGLGAFADQVAFELGEAAEQIEHKPSVGAPGVEVPLTVVLPPPPLMLMGETITHPPKCIFK